MTSGTAPTMECAHRPPGRRILLGVSAGVAAYKAAQLARILIRQGNEVRVVMTPGAERFVGAVTFQALTGYPVRSALFDPEAEAAMGHIELARWADAIVVAPATADVLARVAAGIANDLLTTLILAARAPVYLAPAMNQQMWAAAPTQRNVSQLKADGRILLGPASGQQACGDEGPGRMLEPEDIAAALASTGHAAADNAPVVDGRRLAGRRVVVTAGPTVEPIDPVRFISNRSSGLMGYAVAEAAHIAGADVTLVSGPTQLPAPPGVRRVDVNTAAEMAAAVRDALPACDIFIGAAAVADYAPVAAEHKIKKKAESLKLELQPTTDIIAEVAASKPRPFVVGFAAETRDVAALAAEKRLRKGLDLIAANEVGDGLAFGTPDNALLLIDADSVVTLPRAPKAVLARALIEQIALRLGASAPRPSEETSACLH